MNHEEFVKALEENFKKAIAIVRNKNQDYSKFEDPFYNFRLSEFIGVGVERGILVRISDKFQRIANLLDREAKVKDESIEDTLLDLMNYANILLVYIQQKKGNHDKTAV